MLSKQAFNALLKTLEEPPPHVKFIFATTEIRKVPITVLSRCQRFDLRRVDFDTLMKHFKSIAEQEGVTADETALAAISRTADGSVRDGLSLLDQAIALSDGHVSEEQVKAMLGLGDRGKNLDLLEHVLSGNVAEALAIMDDIYSVGGDASVLIQDLLDLVHQLTKLRAVPALAGQGVGISADEQSRIAEMAVKLSMPSLGKAWQILLKGLNEVNMVANPQSAAEMVVIRLSYGADLPDPSDLLKKLASGGTVSAASGGNTGVSTPAPSGGGVSASRGGLSVASSNSGRTAAAVASQPMPDTEVALSGHHLRDLEGIVHLLEEADEMVLAGRVYQMLHLVRLEQKAETYRLEVRPQESAPDDLLTNLSKSLRAITGKVWMISSVQYGGAPTLAEKAQALYEQELEKINNHPLMKEVYAYFPEAEIIDITQVKD